MITKNFFKSEFYNEVLFETENFIVLPSLGSLIEGWLLIVPKNHYLSFGFINNPSLYDEYKILEKAVCQIVSQEFGHPIIFEHGPSCENSKVGCGIDYAHVHIVPININLSTLNSNILNLNWNSVNDIEDTVMYASNNLPYLYYSNTKDCYLATHDSIPSQFFRKVISDKLGLSDLWNWKEHQFEENVLRTISRLKRYKLSYDFLAEFVK